MAGYLVLKRKSKNNKSLLWTDRFPYSVIAQKLNMQEDAFLAAISENLSRMHEQCAAILLHAKWVFQRTKDNSQVSAQLQMTFTDESTFSKELTVHWDELPGIIRAEFLKTGENALSIKWELPKEEDSEQ